MASTIAGPATWDRGQERGTGGLWGGVEILESGPVALLGLRWQTVEVATGWHCRIVLDLESDQARKVPLQLSLIPQWVEGEIKQTERRLRLAAGRTSHTLTLRLPPLARWEVWERGTPALYRLEACSGDEKQSTTIGFRTIGRDGDWMTLNASGSSCAEPTSFRRSGRQVTTRHRPSRMSTCCARRTSTPCASMPM